MTREEFIEKYGHWQTDAELEQDLDELLKKEAIEFKNWFYISTDAFAFLKDNSDMDIVEYNNRLYQLYKNNQHGRA